MDLTPYVSSIEEHLAAASAGGDEDTRRAAALLAVALEPAARLTIMNALADLAGEITEALDDHTVEIRLEAGGIRVAVEARAGEPQPEPEPGAFAGGDASRITLRLPEELKTKAEEAAAAQSVSLNTWLGQAVRDALRPRGEQRPGRARVDAAHRVRGWVQG